uniref:hypothetical protein n=1 Tax=Acetatifactor sp. TaxID=1872090 RepID=UPI0040572E7B
MKHSKSALVLMELIIVILFFSLASTVCIQLFSKSHLLSKQTVNENHAVIHAQNLAECFLATEGNIVTIKELFASSLPDTGDDTVILLFNEAWQECNEESAVYCASLIAYPEENGLIRADISVSPYSTTLTESIYTLSIVHHIPERRGSHE